MDAVLVWKLSGSILAMWGMAISRIKGGSSYHDLMSSSSEADGSDGQDKLSLPLGTLSSGTYMPQQVRD